jgi:hypothetical protein
MKFEKTAIVIKTGKITRNMLIEALDLPDNADIWFDVPTGGDWSGMRLSIDGGPLALGVSYADEEPKNG